ncbi:putative c6 transcription factor protein [Botrytis cinerea BcDW1]|uniref:Putative c6 transcription factor protein n=1 Tax=Botryotinia fuckeliana (strain BcDW1) TaxID=1290391 RepID=M7TMY0_BOTF1|nr:putative c6 transcription factor protein [Botrytis cinerea BcDW1]
MSKHVSESRLLVKSVGRINESVKARDQRVPYARKEGSCAIIPQRSRESMFPVDRISQTTSLTNVYRRKHCDDVYVRSLEDKVKALEAQLAAYQSSESQSKEYMGHEILPISSPATTSSLAYESEAITPENIDEPNDPRSQVAMEELASLMLTMDIEEKGEPSFTIPRNKSTSKQNSIPGEILTPDISSHDQNLSKIGFYTETRTHLVECFMAAFNIYHQFIEQGELQTILLETTFSIELDFGFRNHALLSVGAFLSPKSDAKELSSHHATSAENILLRSIREYPSDLVVQGLALLSWRELMLENNSMAYTYIGIYSLIFARTFIDGTILAMATGLILHLGLHVSSLGSGKSPDLTLNRNSSADDYVRKRRIRSFWAYFSVDRMVTSSLGMNCTIHWQRIRISSFSSALDHYPSPDELAHDKFCQLWHLWDSFMDQRQVFVSQLKNNQLTLLIRYAFEWTGLKAKQRQNLLKRAHQALTDFYAGTDDKLALSKTSMPQTFLLFQLAYHTAILLIHRPFLNEPKGSETLSFALRSATNAAASIARIIRAYRKFCGFADVNPQVIDYILSAAVIHLLNATSGRNFLGRQSANSLQSCLDALVEIQSTWMAQASRAIREIQELAAKWKVVWALPLQFSQRVPEKEIRQDRIQIMAPMPECTNVLTSNAQMPYVFDTGEFANRHIHPGFNNDFGALWDPSLFENALEHVNLPEHIAYQSSLEWLFDESNPGFQ